MSKEKILESIKHPELEDVAGAWQLVKNSSLDENSYYFYLMMFSYFKDCAAVAKSESGEVIGFICGFSPREDTYFCWQVGVSKDARGQGIAKKLLNYVTKDRYSNVEATFTPNNTASRKLFLSHAKKHDLEVEESVLFDEEHFKGVSHDKEVLIALNSMDA